jgi:hypothetical protein
MRRWEPIKVIHYNILMCGGLTLFTASDTDLITELGFGIKGKVVAILKCHSMRMYWGTEIKLYTF